MEPNVRQSNEQSDADHVTQRACYYGQETDADSENSAGIVSSPLISESMRQIAHVIPAFGISPSLAIVLHGKVFRLTSKNRLAGSPALRAFKGSACKGRCTLLPL